MLLFKACLFSLKSEFFSFINEKRIGCLLVGTFFILLTRIKIFCNILIVRCLVVCVGVMALCVGNWSGFYI